LGDVNLEIGEDGCTITYWDEMAINGAGDKRSKYITFDKEEALAIADAIYKLFKEESNDLPYYVVKGDGMPSSEDYDDDGYCWWGWAHSPGHGNPRFCKASWAYSKEPRGATHWAPHWTFPVIK
jgi:hypothetical protein